jgi:predicted metal-binding protein
MTPAIQRVLSELGVTHAGEVAVADIVFAPAFRDACVANACGKYGTNWACPPGIGEASDLIARAQKFTRGLVLQTVWPLQDAFDFDGMMAGAEKHNALFRKAVARVIPLLEPQRTAALPCAARAAVGRQSLAAERIEDRSRHLALSAGACSICKTCTFPRGEPCRLPEQAMSSLEAYCIDVTALIDTAGLSYTNGPDTVSYVGLLLYG